MTERYPWVDWIDLATWDRGELLLAQVARYAAELSALRPSRVPAEPYARLPLCQGNRGEVMLASWRPGGRSAPHDHGQARGFVVILQGLFVETTYQFDGTELRAAEEREHGIGDLLEAPPGMIHELEAQGAGLTLHVYVPRIEGMRVYDVGARATLRVSDDCGAWVPRRREAVLERRPWLPLPARAESA